MGVYKIIVWEYSKFYYVYQSYRRYHRIVITFWSLKDLPLSADWKRGRRVFLKEF